MQLGPSVGGPGCGSAGHISMRSLRWRLVLFEESHSLSGLDISAALCRCAITTVTATLAVPYGAPRDTSWEGAI